MTTDKLRIEEQTDTRVILAVNHAGKYWEIDIRIDTDEDGGIDADISRDGIICTSTGFGWQDKHENEPQG